MYCLGTNFEYTFISLKNELYNLIQANFICSKNGLIDLLNSRGVTLSHVMLFCIKC